MIAFALFSSCRTDSVEQDVCRLVDLAVLLAPIPYSMSTSSQGPDSVYNNWKTFVSRTRPQQAALLGGSSEGTEASVPFVLRDESIRYNVLQEVLYDICNETLTEVCYEVVCLSFGCLSRKNYLTQSAGHIFGYYPQPSSAQNNIHWDQFKGPLMKFDFGSVEANTEHYGQPTPPVYDLSKLAVDLALFYGSDDPTAQSLINGGPNLLPAHRIVFQRNVTGYGHADFVWGVDAPSTVFPDIVTLLRK